MDLKSKLILANYLKGGIGNQLFQYTFAKSLANKLNADLYNDISFYQADPYHNYSILNLIAPQANTIELANLVGEGAYILRDGIMGSINDPINLPNNAKVLALDGYWQNENLLDPTVVAETYSAITQNQHLIAESDIARNIRSHEDSVAIHLRRRDYAHMGLCLESYYLGAIEFFINHFPGAKLYIYSDEPNYAQNLFGQRYPQMIVVSSGSDLSDLYLMSLCKHFIIANSTYSWWAAYFAESKGGLIVCPKEWITMEGVSSPCPDRWIKVPQAVRAMMVDPIAIDLVKKQIQLELNIQV
jgi:hypothetical protein